MNVSAEFYHVAAPYQPSRAVPLNEPCEVNECQRIVHQVDKLVLAVSIAWTKPIVLTYKGISRFQGFSDPSIQ